MKKGLLPLFLSLLIALFSCETDGFIELPTQSEINDADRDQTDDTSKTEIDILGLEISINDGDTTPAESDNTDYKKVNFEEGTVSHEFVIKNTGLLDLKLTGSDPYVTITPGANTASADFTLTTKPSNIIAPEGSSIFIIKFDPTTEGVKTASISIANNDADENPYNFTITGEGIKTDVVLKPEIDITGLNQSISNGDSTPIDTDNTLYSKVNINNGSISHEFIIKNTGEADLELSSNLDSLVVITPGANTNANDFSITTKPSQSIATDGSSKFTIKFDPNSVGVKTAIISIVNNDEDENPFTYTIQGEGTEEASQPTEIDITGLNQSILDGDTTPTGTDNTDYGSLNVTSGSVSHEFVIKNIGEMDLELTDNDPYVIITPGANTNASDFILTTKPVNTITPNGSTKFIIKFDPSGEGVKTATVSIANNDADENPYNFTIKGEGATPEIDILGLDISITNGDDTPDSADDTQYGQTNIATGSVSHEFKIQNLGGADLKLTGAYPYVVIIPGVNTEASEFSLTLNPASGIVPSGSTSFIIKFNPSSEGIKTAQISIASDDANENPYTFTIEGEGFDDGTVDPNTPCSFTTNDIIANSTITIDCLLDLGGQTINLPSNVNFDYAGGQIINGTLNFNGGYIEGDLLNYTLGIEGNAVLKSPIFEFVPERWEIVQGQTTSTIALKNNKELERLMLFTKGLGATTFKIDKFDAYFEISTVTSTTADQNWYPSVEAINIPSDFNLVMTPNTHIRTFPGSGFGNAAGALIAIRDESNVTITGGVLHGDRDQYIYTDGIGNNEEGSHLLKIHSGVNVVIDGVKMVDGSVGGIDIHSIGFTFQSNYKPSHTITVKNCLFENIRRSSLVITDGYDILIENNTFLKSGQPTAISAGGLVGYAINIEAERARDAQGNLIIYQKAQDIIIRNNIERESRVGGFTLTIGENVTFDNNDMEGKIVYSFTSGTKIINNRFNASLETAKTPAISGGATGETVFNNEISGNYISGYGNAISASNSNIKIFDNIIENNGTGIQLKSASNIYIYNNTISSQLSNSTGIRAHVTNADNVNISNNTISVKTNNLYFVSLNQNSGEENFKINVENNIFTSSTAYSVFSNANGVIFQNNISNNGLLLLNVSRIDLLSNEINSISHGIHLQNSISEIFISGNDITVPQNSFYVCIKNDATSQSQVNIDGTNICN